MCSVTEERGFLLQNVFCYYRMCSRKSIFLSQLRGPAPRPSYNRMCSLAGMCSVTLEQRSPVSLSPNSLGPLLVARAHQSVIKPPHTSTHPIIANMSPPRIRITSSSSSSSPPPPSPRARVRACVGVLLLSGERFVRAHVFVCVCVCVCVWG